MIGTIAAPAGLSGFSVERNEERVLILAPTDRDVTLICDMLLSGGIPGDVCASVDELTRK